MSSLVSPRVSRRFSDRIGPGESDELTHEVVADATVEKVEVRFYPGTELDVELRPFIEPDQGNHRISMVDLIGRDVIVGDDDVFTFHVGDAIEEGDLIGVEVTNNEPNYGYNWVVHMDIDRRNGVESVVDRIEGWL